MLLLASSSCHGKDLVHIDRCTQGDRISLSTPTRISAELRHETSRCSHCFENGNVGVYGVCTVSGEMVEIQISSSSGPAEYILKMLRACLTPARRDTFAVVGRLAFARTFASDAQQDVVIIGGGPGIIYDCCFITYLDLIKLMVSQVNIMSGNFRRLRCCHQGWSAWSEGDVR